VVSCRVAAGATRLPTVGQLGAPVPKLPTADLAHPLKNGVLDNYLVIAATATQLIIANDLYKEQS
jgi:hypothetical protein